MIGDDIGVLRGLGRRLLCVVRLIVPDAGGEGLVGVDLVSPQCAKAFSEEGEAFFGVIGIAGFVVQGCGSQSRMRLSWLKVVSTSVTYCFNVSRSVLVRRSNVFPDRGASRSYGILPVFRAGWVPRVVVFVPAVVRRTRTW